MIEYIDLCIDMQKRVIDAHEQSLVAARKAIDTAAAVDLEQAVGDATAANVAAWNKWLAAWGWRK